MTTILESVNSNHISNCLNCCLSSLSNQFFIFSSLSLRFSLGVLNPLQEIFQFFFNLFLLIHLIFQIINFLFLFWSWILFSGLTQVSQGDDTINLLVNVSLFIKDFFMILVDWLLDLGLWLFLLGSAGTHFQKLYLNLLIIPIAVDDDF